VNFFDTANEYAAGRAEEVVGTALASVPRASYVLATKVFFPIGERPTERGLSRKHVFDQAHASLRRLGTDYVDVYQCHRYDLRTPVVETCRVMNDLIRAGKVLYWGVSEWSGEQIADAVLTCREHGWDPPVSNQPQYSLLYRRIETDALPVARALGLGTVAWSPLAMGVLTGKYRSVDDVPPESRAATDDAHFLEWYFRQSTLDAVASLEPLAAESGVSVAQLALAWCLRAERATSVIVGARTPAQVEQNTAVADVDVPDAVLEEAGDRLRSAARDTFLAKEGGS
jgi:aryl-alcohol dehydrogenase-like predicted oxidoreductase